MKNVCKVATLTLMMLAVTVCGFSQRVYYSEASYRDSEPGAGRNWTGRRQFQLSNYSVFNLVPGSGLFPITSTTTVFYFGFTAGTEADISNMVVYTTPRGSLTISAATPVKLGGVSNPSIVLSNTSVCPVAPSTTIPCIVRFDPTTITLSPASDYYFVVYFTNNSNNAAIAATQPNNNQTSLAGTYFGGTDYTHLTAGQSIPGAAARGPSFLMYVMNN